MKYFLMSLGFLFSTVAIAQSTPQNQSIFIKNQKFDNEGVELYGTNTEMKLYKKLGLGVTLGGSTGVLGINGEINLDRTEAAVIGLGAGPSYGSFSVGWKHNFEAQYFSPYTKVGYSKWFSSAGKNATDSDILQRVFSDDELRSGHFDANFAIGALGVEYNQLEGELAGVNFFGEVIMMAEIAKSVFIPSGGVGVIYYY
jgi:hypothetical protein